MQLSTTMAMTEDRQILTFEWVLVSNYPHALGKALEVGSVSCFPSTL
jgi:hypothetical protein